jgi:hypothetical protein
MNRNNKVVPLLEKRRLQLKNLLARWERLEKTEPRPQERFPCYNELSREQQYLFAAIVKIAKEEMPFASCDIPLEHGPALIRVMTMRRASYTPRRCGGKPTASTWKRTSRWRRIVPVARKIEACLNG